MTRYRLLADAAEELRHAVEYYEESSHGLGENFLDEFERATDLICGMQKLGALLTMTSDVF